MHGISKEDAEKKLAVLGMDGAAVNMGRKAGVKALIQRQQGDTETDPALEYFGWYWVIILHCINH